MEPYSRNRTPESEPQEIVARTTGEQPARRVFHAANGILIVLALEILLIRTSTALALLGAVLAALLLLDGARLADPRLNRLFFQLFTPLASPKEARGIASSTWYLLGVLLALLLFPRKVALAGILVMALADPAAGWAGRRWGRRSFLGGTLEGTLAFLGVAFLALLPFVPPLHALAAAAVGAGAERLPGWLDDNLTLPLAVGSTLLILGVA